MDGSGDSRDEGWNTFILRPGSPGSGVERAARGLSEPHVGRKPGVFRTPVEALAAFAISLVSGTVVVVFFYGAFKLAQAAFGW